MKMQSSNHQNSINIIQTRKFLLNLDKVLNKTKNLCYNYDDNKIFGEIT